MANLRFNNQFSVASVCQNTYASFNVLKKVVGFIVAAADMSKTRLNISQMSGLQKVYFFLNRGDSEDRLLCLLVNTFPDAQLVVNDSPKTPDHTQESSPTD